MKLAKILTIITLTILSIAVSLPANARIAGTTGRTTSGCGGVGCHSGVIVPTATISGPNAVLTGTVQSYTLTGAAPGTAYKGCSVDIGASDGTLLPGSNTKLSGIELVHDGIIPIVGGVCTVNFIWNAPLSAGSVSLYYALLMTNMDGTPAGDIYKTGTYPITVYADGSSATTTGSTSSSTTTSSTTTSSTTTTATTTETTSTTTSTDTTTTSSTTTTETTSTTITSTSTSTTGTTTTIKGDTWPPTLPAAAEYCGYCHGLTIGKWRIAYPPYAGAPDRHKPAGMRADKWKRIINKMIQKQNCPLPSQEVNNLARYFASLKR